MVKKIYPQRKTDPIAPKPVHTTAIRHHALFGPAHIRQHMMMDERWRNEDLIEEYFNMTELSKKRYIFKKLEKKQSGKRMQEHHKNLRHQVYEGRLTLQNALSGDVEQALRLILINHKNMQRLYVKMPLHQVEENINQRTFVMRKERDRLTCHLEKLKKDMEEKLISRSHLENRIRFKNEFILQEELIQRSLHKDIENSHSRLKAIQSINTTYKKIIQVLENDHKFHEPILQSLAKDIEDQQNFIGHILYEGTPAMAKLSELKQDIWRAEDNKRKLRHSKTQWLGELKRTSLNMKRSQSLRASGLQVNWKKRYVRDTPSMLTMKRQLLRIEEKVKAMQEATLSSTPVNIYSTFKQQINRNLVLSKQISLNRMQSQALTDRLPNLSYGKEFLMNDFYRISQLQDDYIKHLQNCIADEEEKEEGTMSYLKGLGNVSVVLRCSLWNIFDILRHVHLKRESTVKRKDYPKSYLKLPLLKYEMEMRAVPPTDFEENTLKVLNIITHKLKKLMPIHDRTLITSEGQLATDVIDDIKAKYCSEYLNVTKSEEFIPDLMTPTIDKRMTFESSKNDLNLPSRKYLKDLSRKIVDTSSKKDE